MAPAEPPRMLVGASKSPVGSSRQWNDESVAAEAGKSSANPRAARQEPSPYLLLKGVDLVAPR